MRAVVLLRGSNKNIFRIFSDFMACVAKLEELAAAGGSLIASFHRGLDFLRQPPIDKKSKLVESILKANESRWISVYMDSGCVNAHDKIENISQLHTCQLGLIEHLSQARCIMEELEGIVKETTDAIEMENENKDLEDEVTRDEFGLQRGPIFDEEEFLSCELGKFSITDYAATMAVVYSMLKQDFVMQEKIISSLNFKSSSGELESYSLMWTLRPYIDDTIMHQAWKLIP